MQTFDHISFDSDILKPLKSTKINLMITDYITAAILLYLFYKGWRKGFLKTLLGPISLVIGCIMAFVYYQRTHNITTSLLICFFSPFVLKFLASIFLKLWHKAVNNNDPLSTSSRLMGSGISILWGGSYFVILYIMIAMVPLRIPWFEKIQSDVTSSHSYAFIEHWVINKIPGASLDIKKITELLEDPSKLEKSSCESEHRLPPFASNLVCSS